MRFITLLLIYASPLVSFATSTQELQKTPYEAANLKYQAQYQESLKKLGDLGVASALHMKTTLGYINDESASYRLPSLYWVETHGEDKVKLDNDRITTIPIAANNILQNVVERGWDKKIELSESDPGFKEWQANKGKVPTHYVATDLEGNRRFKDVDDFLYFKAQRTYDQAKKDSEALHLALADTTPVLTPLEDYWKANEELTAISKKINSVVGRLPGRSPATGEHKDEVMTESPANN